MAFTKPFTPQEITNPQQAARARAISAALIARPQAKNWAEGLAALTGAYTARNLDQAAGEAETAGNASVAEALAGLGPSSSMNDIAAALSNPWVNQAQASVPSALLQNQMQQADPYRQLQMQQLEQQIAQGSNPYLNVGGGSVFDQTTGEFLQSPGAGSADLPSDVQEYNWYAEQEAAAGRQPLPYIDFINAQKGAGLSVTTDPTTGATTVTQGGPSGLKLTEGQGKDIGFYTRGTDANAQLSNLDGQLTDWGQQNAGKIPLGLGNYFREPAFRQAKVAADSFLTAILRKDTGAAITDQEFETYGPIFLPVPGDDPGTIQQKRRARQVALLAIRSGLGTAEAIAEANEVALGLDSPNPGPSAPAPSGGFTILSVE